MNAQAFAKLYSQLSKLLAVLSEAELVAAVEGKALIALTVEMNGAARTVGSVKKTAKKPQVSIKELAAQINTAASRVEVLNLIDQHKLSAPALKELLLLFYLPANGIKLVLAKRLADHIGSRADALAIRQV
jgi:hypothetical protein